MSEKPELVRMEQPEAIYPSYRGGPTIAAESDDSERYLYLRDYWNVLIKRRWTVLTSVLVLTTLAAIVSFQMPDIYQAVTRVELEAETPSIQSLNDLDRTMPTNQTFVETQAEVIQTDHLAWRTIQELRLGENPVFTRDLGLPGGDSADARALIQARLIKRFHDSLEVRLVMRTRLVEVKFTSPDPKLAALAVNKHVANYIEYNFRKRYDATRQTSGWMEQQLDDLKAKVEKSQQALVDYERTHSIVNVSDKQNVAEQRLADLSRDFTNAQSERLERESLYDLVRANESQIAFLAQSGLLQRLEEKHAELKTQYVDALGQYGPNFPKVVRLRDQVSEIQSLIEQERARVVSRIRNEYMAACGREALLSEALGKEKAAVGRLNQLLIQQNILKREFETNQQLYDSLLQRLKDATVSAGLRATNIHVVDPALPPSVPARPKKLLNIAIGLLLGLAVGIALAFIKEGLDTSVKSAEDVEKLTASPALAIIPAASTNGTRSAWLKRTNGSKVSATGHAELAMLNQPTSHIAECYRALRTAVLLSMAPRPPQVLLVTSAQPSEGKTCTALNLTFALAQRGARVLIIDADLRKPGIAAPLGLTSERGLSSVLTGASTLEESLYQHEVLPNLLVLPAGPCPPNPAELLSSPFMEDLLRRLREKFDHLVIDSPPSLLVTDATVLSSIVDATILVAQPGITTRSALARVHRILESSGARVMGVVLNRVTPQNTNFHYYGYGDSYYYGQPREESTSYAQPPGDSSAENPAHLR